MKFDTPATTNPIDQLKVDRQAEWTASTASSRSPARHALCL